MLGLDKEDARGQAQIVRLGSLWAMPPACCLVSIILRLFARPPTVSTTAMAFVNRFWCLRSMAKNEPTVSPTAAPASLTVSRSRFCVVAFARYSSWPRQRVSSRPRLKSVREACLMWPTFTRGPSSTGNPRSLHSSLAPPLRPGLVPPCYRYACCPICSCPWWPPPCTWQADLLAPVMENILLAERALLYTLAFDLQTMQPVNELSAYFRRLGLATDRDGVTTLEDKAGKLYINTIEMVNSRCMHGRMGGHHAGYTLADMRLKHGSRIIMMADPVFVPHAALRRRCGSSTSPGSSWPLRSTASPSRPISSCPSPAASLSSSSSASRRLSLTVSPDGLSLYRCTCDIAPLR